MTTPTITIALDQLSPSNAAIRWAVREAARRRADLRVVMPRDREDDDTAAKLAASADAELLVVAGPAPDVDELVTRAYCPVVVVPVSGWTRFQRDSRPVVVGAGPATEPEVIAFAFAEATARRANLLAVRTWNDPLIDLGFVLSGRLDRWDRADEQARADLAQQLSLPHLAYPEVAVEQLVVNERCAERLDAVAQRAQLVVLGRPARGALLAATVSWPSGTKKPKTRQLHGLTGAGALGGAFWGLLFGLLFFIPPRADLACTSVVATTARTTDVTGHRARARWYTKKADTPLAGRFSRDR